MFMDLGWILKKIYKIKSNKIHKTSDPWLLVIHLGWIQKKIAIVKDDWKKNISTLPETNSSHKKNGWLEYKPFLLGQFPPIFRGDELC